MTYNLLNKFYAIRIMRKAKIRMCKIQTQSKALTF